MIIKRKTPRVKNDVGSSGASPRLDQRRLAMPVRPEATIVLQKCPTSKKLLGVRIQKKNNGKWYTVWSFPLDESRAHRENYDDNQINDVVYIGDEYKGCPYCGKQAFVQCGQCHKLSCHDGSATTCPWCGNRMTQFSSGEFDLHGGDL